MHGRAQEELISSAADNRRWFRGAVLRVLTAALICALAGASAASASTSRLAGDPFTGAYALAPWSASAPTVTGAPIIGSPLTAQPGLWTGPSLVALSFAWYRCPVPAAPCAPIDGAVAATYTPVAADVGSSLIAEVDASDAGGSASAPTLPVGPIMPLPPEDRTIASALIPQLLPAGDGLNVAVALTGRGLKLPVRAPYGGTLQISWYVGGAPGALAYLPSNLIASGSARYAAAGAGSLVIRATAAGRKLLQRSRQVAITVLGTFGLPFAYGPPVAVSAGFTLR
jgi:hypothetical protein